MAVENDILTGLDVSALSSVSQAQLLQMINQAAPLVNKGLIVVQATTPDIGNNARYSRYIWLDSSTTPPTPKIYNTGTLLWDSLIIGAGSIVNSMISAAAAIAITKLAFGTARYIVRTNAAGNAVEYVNPNAIFTNDDVPLSAINSTAAPALVKSYLQRNATTGITSFQQVAFADFAAGDLLGVSKIASGTNGQVLGTVTGATTWTDLVSLILPNTLTVDKLTGATGARQVIRRNVANNANEWAAPVFSVENAVLDSNNIGVRFPLGAATIIPIAHGLGAIPKIIFPVIRCTIDDSAAVGWIAGDEIPFHSFVDATAVNNAGRPCLNIGGWDGTNIYVAAYNIAAARNIPHKTTGGSTSVTNANWTVKLYAYA
jgi:hypothetical protein